MITGLSAVGSAVAGAGAAVGLGAAGTAVATGLGTVGIFLTTVGPAGAGIIFGATGAGLTGFKLGKRYGDLKEFVFVPMFTEKKVTAIAAFGGWNYITRLQLFFADGNYILYGEENDGTAWEQFILKADEYLTGVSGLFTPDPYAQRNLGYSLE